MRPQDRRFTSKVITFIITLLTLYLMMLAPWNWDLQGLYMDPINNWTRACHGVTPSWQLWTCQGFYVLFKGVFLASGLLTMRFIGMGTSYAAVRMITWVGTTGQTRLNSLLFWAPTIPIMGLGIWATYNGNPGGLLATMTMLLWHQYFARQRVAAAKDQSVYSDRQGFA